MVVAFRLLAIEEHLRDCCQGEFCGRVIHRSFCIHNIYSSHCRICLLGSTRSISWGSLTSCTRNPAQLKIVAYLRMLPCRAVSLSSHIDCRWGHDHFILNLGRLVGQACNLGSKRVGVSVEYVGNGLLSNRFIFHVVAASIAIAVLAVLAAGKTFAVKLQTSGVFAIAILFPRGQAGEGHPWLGKVWGEVHALLTHLGLKLARGVLLLNFGKGVLA